MFTKISRGVAVFLLLMGLIVVFLPGVAQGQATPVPGGMGDMSGLTMSTQMVPTAQPTMEMSGMNTSDQGNMSGMDMLP